ncbi:MAG: general secretion pathway protein GspK [candidate division NC10 bacterium]|nr:general secretion pathway protein GspK [candidate division NC10 bacterium]
MGRPYPKPETRNPKHGLHSECGMALMVVLWILALLGIIFTTFAFSMRTELAATGNFKEAAEAYYIAEAGVYRAAAEIINADRNVIPDSSLYDALDEHWHTNPSAYENVPVGRGNYWVTVTDEESKISLNSATDPILRRLFSNSGVGDEKLLSTIVDSILDWRDPDNLHRLNGAEDDYYLSLPTPYRAKNGNFESIDELLLVKGMTPEILYGNVANPQRRAELEAQLPWERKLMSGEYLGVARLLSVFSSGRVNINTASPEVLMALGLTAAEAKIALARRTEAPFRNVGELTNLMTSVVGPSRQGFALVPGGQPGPASPQQLLAGLSQIGAVLSRNFYVESVGRATGSMLVGRVAAILRNEGSAGQPKLTIQLWSLDPRQGA